MSDAIAQLNGLGWEWRPDGAGTGAGPGVLFTVAVGGRQRRVFVPLTRVWVTFDRELSKVGCASAASVGAPFSVGGFFSFVKKAVKSAGSVASKAVPKAIKKAAAKVVSTAKSAVSTVARTVSKVPVLGTGIKALTALQMLPATAAGQLLSGKRIDRVAMSSLKSAVANTRTLAPYVQTVISVVPGVGQGLSAGIGGALALAEGQSITDAMLAATKAAVPGGPIAQAAFSVAADAMQGKPIDQIALNALPIPPQQKELLARGLSAAKDLAAGKRVDQVLVDTALKSLPPNVQRAVQVGAALGHARTLQQGMGVAKSLAGTYANGVTAARAFKGGNRSPAVLAAMQRAQTARDVTSNIVRRAGQGNTLAAHIQRAMSLRTLPRVAAPVMAFGF